MQNVSYAIGPIIYFFTVYSLFGWLLENFHSLFTRRLFLKPNFFLGPFKPMYGFAPVILVSFISPQTNRALTLFLCFLIPTAIEYVSGILLERLSRKKWWDYSTISLNIQGHICLTYSLCWIFLSYMCVYFLHPKIEHSFQILEPLVLKIWPLLLAYFLAEFLLAIRRHIGRNQSLETIG
ncbi:putative ABC transporter permease [Robertmurraya sp. Marseille-Q9965]